MDIVVVVVDGTPNDCIVIFHGTKYSDGLSHLLSWKFVSLWLRIKRRSFNIYNFCYVLLVIDIVGAVVAA